MCQRSVTYVISHKAKVGVSIVGSVLIGDWRAIVDILKSNAVIVGERWTLIVLFDVCQPFL